MGSLGGPSSAPQVLRLPAVSRIRSRQPPDMRLSSQYTLLTGATGHLGSVLTRDLLGNGTRVAVLFVAQTPQFPVDVGCFCAFYRMGLRLEALDAGCLYMSY